MGPNRKTSPTAPAQDGVSSEWGAHFTARRVANWLVAPLFLVGAGMTAAAVLMPNRPPQADVQGYCWLVVAEVCFALLLFAWSRVDSPRDHALKLMSLLLPIVVVTAAIYLNGERRGGTALGNEVFYIWPAFYAGYFYSRNQIVMAVLAIGGAYFGVLLAIHTPGDALPTRLLLLVTAIGGTASITHGLRVQVDTLLSRLTSLARTDPLTSLLNRRAFAERAEMELERSRRTGEPVALVTSDIDHFKQINDRFGHAAGDDALRAVGETLVRSTRSPDAVARVGGEEFALLLPSTSLGDAVAVAERARRAVSELRNPAGEPITMSFGVAPIGAGSLSLDSAMTAADDALYVAKAEGRDRTVCADQPPAPRLVPTAA